MRENLNWRVWKIAALLVYARNIVICFNLVQHKHSAQTMHYVYMTSGQPLALVDIIEREWERIEE